jgi:hypothetical protein
MERSGIAAFSGEEISVPSSGGGRIVAQLELVNSSGSGLVSAFAAVRSAAKSELLIPGERCCGWRDMPLEKTLILGLGTPLGLGLTARAWFAACALCRRC